MRLLAGRGSYADGAVVAGRDDDIARRVECPAYDAVAVAVEGRDDTGLEIQDGGNAPVSIAGVQVEQQPASVGGSAESLDFFDQELSVTGLQIPLLEPDS